MASMSCPSSSILLNAICDVIEDSSFSTGSKEALDALEAAKRVKKWCEREGNGPPLSVFSRELVSDLQTTFSSCDYPGIFLCRYLDRILQTIAKKSTQRSKSLRRELYTDHNV